MKVWIDTDIGSDVDDAVALLCAARHPDVELVGVSTVLGRVEVRAWLARELLDRADLAGVPVLPGAARPVSGAEPPAEAGSYGVLAPPMPRASPEDDEARIPAIAAAMSAAGAPFHLVTIGPLGNLPRLLDRHPEVARCWQSVTCMAGRLEGAAEYNVGADAPAAKMVCERLGPRLVGLEACSDTLGRAETEALLDPSDPASAFLLDCYREYRGGREQAPLTLFDPISLLSLVVPEAFDFQGVNVMVERDGRLRLTDDGARVEYALSRDWGKLRPQIEALLRAGRRR